MLNDVIDSYQNYVGGEWVDAIEGGTREIVNPADKSVIARVPAGTAADVDRAVRAAQRALPGWKATTPRERSEALLKIAEVIEDNMEELALLESRNVGKPLPQARDEITGWTADAVRFFAGAARCLEGRSAGEYVTGYTSMIRREPVGIIGQIVPWNYPLLVAVLKFAPALAAGNVSILKPAEHTPLTVLHLARFLDDVLPPGVLNFITGDGDPVGTGLVNHPDVRMVSLTGDVATGREVARAAAGTLKRVHLELGGKAPVIVLDDADPAAVAEGIKVAGYWNSGQECAAASRVLAGPKIFDGLIENLVPAVESLRVGDPAQGGELDMGPVVSKVHQERVMGFVDRLGDEGRVLTGGGTLSDQGYFVEPTLVVDVDQTAEIVQREVFGPVVTVQRFSDDDEALAWANGVGYGLSASIWTSSVSRALKLAQLEFGTVWINDHLVLAAEMPFGGYKNSGYGKEFSSYSLEDYTQIKHVMAKWGE